MQALRTKAIEDDNLAKVQRERIASETQARTLLENQLREQRTATAKATRELEVMQVRRALARHDCSHARMKGQSDFGLGLVLWNKLQK